jgi:DNA-binding winged helix-turn-helix (wHTH) protein
LLVQKQGEVIEKSKILDKARSDSFVEESNLVVHISALRRDTTRVSPIFATMPDSPRFCEN